jgi:serine protease Do
MKNLIFLITLFCLTLNLNTKCLYASNIRNKQVNKVIFDKISPYVYEIKTALNEQSAKHSYGSSFVVDKDGLLITNYHVVNQALHESKKYKTFIKINKKIVQAKVVGFDVIHDLALVKVNHKFKDQVKIISNTQKIKQGNKLYSLGIPKDLKLTINEGIMNGYIKIGPYEDILMSSPINSGMSGGPTVNSKGKLIGINVSILMGSDNISFSVPAFFAKKLIERYKKSIKNKKNLNKIHNKYYDKKNLHQEIERQVLISEKILMKDLLNNPKNETINLTGFTVRKTPKYLKCWFNNKDHSKKVYERKSTVCILSKGTYLKENKYFATYEIKLDVLKSKKLNNVLFYDYVNKIFGLRGGYNPIITKKRTDKEFSTRSDCQNDIILNKNNIPFKMSYCLTGYLDYPNLYDIKIKSVSLLKEKKSIILNAAFYGFSAKSIKDFITQWPNHIKSFVKKKVKVKENNK